MAYKTINIVFQPSDTNKNYKAVQRLYKRLNDINESESNHDELKTIDVFVSGCDWKYLAEAWSVVMGYKKKKRNFNNVKAHYSTWRMIKKVTDDLADKHIVVNEPRKLKKIAVNKPTQKKKEKKENKMNKSKQEIVQELLEALFGVENGAKKDAKSIEEMAKIVRDIFDKANEKVARALFDEYGPDMVKAEKVIRKAKEMSND